VFVCVYMFVFSCVHVCMCVSPSAARNLESSFFNFEWLSNACVCVCVRERVCVVCVCECVYVCVCLHACVCVCVYFLACVCVCRHRTPETWTAAFS